MGSPKTLHLCAVQSGHAGEMHVTFMEHHVPGPLCPSIPAICQSADLCTHKQPFAWDFQRPENQRQVVKILTFPLGNLSEQ